MGGLRDRRRERVEREREEGKGGRVEGRRETSIGSDRQTYW